MSRDARSAHLPRSRTIQERIRSRQNPDSVQVRVDFLSRIAVSAVDRMGNESKKAFLDMQIGEVTEKRVEGNE